MRVHGLSRRFLLASALALVALMGVAGCHNSSVDTDSTAAALAAFKPVPDTPTNLPPTFAIFQTSMAPGPTPAEQVAKTTLPSAPPDVDKVAQMAVSTAAPVSVSAAAPADAGLIVSDPVTSRKDLNLFSAGCGRWLDLVAAGQPELGRTPEWEARERATREMKRPTMQFKPADSSKLAGMTGATVAAFGTLTGTPTSCTLTYRLCKLPSGAPFGPTLSKSGTESQIIAALPAMAKQIDQALGVAAPRIPSSVGLTPAQLAQLIALGIRSSGAQADLAALAKLADLSPLGGCYYLDSDAANDRVLLNRMVKTLVTQQPENALVLEHIGYDNATSLRSYAPQIAALTARYPKSALLGQVEVWSDRNWGTRDQERKAAERLVADSPDDPDSWLTIAYTLSNIASDLRQGRFAGDISAAEWRVLKRLYAEQEQARLQAVKIDPTYGNAWLMLAQAATELGDYRVAENAIEKALTFTPDDSGVYGWALEMYQPKWIDNSDQLHRFAELAAAHNWVRSADVTDLATDLNNIGLKALGTKMLTDYVAAVRKVIAKRPSDMFAHWGLADALAMQEGTANLREATLEYRVAEHLMPSSLAIHERLGNILYSRDRYAESEKEFRLAIALDPFVSDDHATLGRLLKHDGLYAQALTELSLAMRLDPRNAGVHETLGDLEAMRHNYAKAAVEYREAVRMNYFDTGAWYSMPNALDSAGQYDETIRMGIKADHVLSEVDEANGETEPPVLDAVSDAYLHKKAWKSSIAESAESLKYNPSDACAYENYGEAYIGEGKKADARAAWQKAVSLGDPQITPVAEKMLAKYP